MLIIAIVAVLGPGIGNMYLAMWLVGWTSYARLVRSAVMVEKNAEYVQAARDVYKRQTLFCGKQSKYKYFYKRGH